MFSLKGPRFAVNRRVLGEAGDSIKRFLDSGITELGDKLGPLLWQFAPFKKFDAADFGKFLELLPDKFDGRTLRHVVEVRHDSFKTPEFIALLRNSRCRRFTPITTSIRTSPTSPAISSTRGCNGAKTSADRLSAEGADGMGRRACKPGRRARAEGPAARRCKHKPKAAPRDVFAYVIHEGKVRAPAAAMALIEKLKE